MSTYFPFETATPESQGISSRDIVAFIDEIEARHLEMHSIIISRHGKVITEGYWAPYTKKPHRLYSAAKAITAVQMLFAIQEGLAELDTKVCDILPEAMPAEMTDWLRELTVYHLLTMTTGHAKDPFYNMLKPDLDRAAAFFSVPLSYKPGTYFLYNNGVPDILAIICMKLTGQSCFEYLEPRLFKPLGMSNWRAHQNGEQQELPTMAFELRDFFKFTVMLSQGGVWEGKQILRRDLAEALGKHHVPTVTHAPNAPLMDHTAGYGWQVWRNSVGGYRLDGGKGQFGVVLPELDIVVALNSDENMAGEELRVMWDKVTRRASMRPLEEDAEAYDALCRRLESMSLAPKGSGSGSANGSWKLSAPIYGRESIALSEKDGVITLTADDKEPVSFAADGSWSVCTMPFTVAELIPPAGSFALPPTIAGEDPAAAFVSAVWREKDLLEVHFRSDAWDGGYCMEFDLSDGLAVTSRPNGVYNLLRRPGVDTADPRLSRMLEACITAKGI